MNDKMGDSLSFMWSIYKEGMKMGYKWNGPWHLKHLIDDPNIQ